MFFTCNWITNHNGVLKLDHLFGVAFEVGVNLFWTQKMLDNKLIDWQFFLEANSKETLEEFTQRAKPYFELLDWQPILKEEVRGFSTPPMFSEGRAYSIWYESVLSIASANKDRLDKMKRGQSGSP